MVTSYDLLVLGAGSGNMVFTDELTALRCAIVEPDRFGGTCLNRGCIPSKMFVVTASLAHDVTTAGRLGVDAELRGVDWPAVRDRIFDRIDPLHEKAVAARRRSGVDVYEGAARFVGDRTVEVDGERLRADRIVVAAGSRPATPPIDGLDRIAFHTSDTIMRLEELPASLLVIGGGAVAVEMSHVFSAFGTDVTIVQRGDRLLRGEEPEIGERLTRRMAERVDVRLDATVASVRPGGAGVVASVEGPAGTSTVEAETVLVATGRRPNNDLLDVAAGGIEVDEHGHLVTDQRCATTAEGVWALGDVANHFQLKHMANAEARIVAHNVLHPDDLRALPTSLAPHAVFGEPEVAAVGMTEAAAREAGIDPVVATREYSRTAYGWALEDTSSLVKLVAHPRDRTLLGAHIVGPHASMLIQPLLQGMMLGSTVDEMGTAVLYIHPALTEVVEQALLDL